LAPGDLEHVLSQFVWEQDDRILVSGQGAEDAVVINFPSQKAMVQSVDFLTPMVNEPYAFGCIAAANALSDIYAMGGMPFSAMNIVGFPKDCMPLDVLTEILRGGYETVRSAGAVMAGGHTVDDPELKFGLAVTGVIDADQIATNSGARAGDLLVLTKPIGTGVLATGIKAQWDNADALESQVISWAGRLNAEAGRVIQEHRLTGATDITGFGLAGHAQEMAKASGTHITIWTNRVPIMQYAQELATMGLIPAGAFANKTYCSQCTHADADVDPVLFDLMFDPQTSGGLLLAVSEAKLDFVQAALHGHGDLAEVVGKVLPAKDNEIGVSFT